MDVVRRLFELDRFLVYYILDFLDFEYYEYHFYHSAKNRGLSIIRMPLYSFFTSPEDSLGFISVAGKTKVKKRRAWTF
jgi:hypothetical protein